MIPTPCILLMPNIPGAQTLGQAPFLAQASRRTTQETNCHSCALIRTDTSSTLSQCTRHLRLSMKNHVPLDTKALQDIQLDVDLSIHIANLSMSIVCQS